MIYRWSILQSWDTNVMHELPQTKTNEPQLHTIELWSQKTKNTSLVLFETMINRMPSNWSHSRVWVPSVVTIKIYIYIFCVVPDSGYPIVGWHLESRKGVKKLSTTIETEPLKFWGITSTKCNDFRARKLCWSTKYEHILVHGLLEH